MHVDEFYPISDQMEFQGHGTGFLIDASGYIVTNNHVIENDKDTTKAADEIYVMYGTSLPVPATVVGRDPLADLAVIKVDPDFVTKYNLEPIKFAQA